MSKKLKQIRIKVELVADYYEGNKKETAGKIVDLVNTTLQEAHLDCQPQLIFFFDDPIEIEKYAENK